MGRVLGYRRVSTQEQAQEGFSLAAQMERIEAFSRSQSWVLHEMYTDDGYSAKDMDRPALQRLLMDMQPTDIVVVYRLDRLTRSVMDLHALLRIFDERKVAFRSVTEVYDTTTAMGRLFITLVAAMAQWERENLAERVQMGMREAVRQGKWMGGPRPYGYLPVDGQLIPHPEEAPIYREIVRRYLAGAGARGVSLWLEEQGLKPQRGKLWRHKQVMYLLRNPVYRGDTVYGKHKWRGKTLVPGETITVPATHEPLISPEEWDELQRVLNQRTTLPPRTAGSPYPLSGLARCSKCGRTMRFTRAHKSTTTKKHTYHQYYCNGITHKECDTKRHYGPTLEHTVLNELVRLVDRAEMEEVVSHRLATQTNVGPKREQVEADIHRLRSELKRLDEDYRKGELTGKTHARMAAPLEEELDKLQATLESVPPCPATTIMDVDSLIDSVSSIIGVWDKATGEQKRELLRSVFDVIWVNPDGSVRMEMPV